MNDKRVILWAPALILFTACPGDDTRLPVLSGGTVDPTTDTPTTTVDPTDGVMTEGPMTAGTADTTAGGPACGDGVVDDGETCDDGNTDAGDGCDDACATEPGWSCDGEPSACTESCGDGIVTASEGCDDGNTDAGDGCDDTCAAEDGYECTGEPSTCATVCGDGTVAGDEACDDGNTDAGDGCDDACVPEAGFDCTDPTMCTPICGDGIVTMVEDCDDGNTDMGDGCDGTCVTEPGYACMGEPSMCGPVCGDGMIVGAEECDDANVVGMDGCNPMCGVEVGWQCMGEPSMCLQCSLLDLKFTEMSIGTDYIEFTNTGMCPLDLGGLIILFDDSSSPDLTTNLPMLTILPGQTLQVHESAGVGDIDAGGNIFFSSTRGGAALLCDGACTGPADVLDVVAFSEGEPAPPLPPGVTFFPGGIMGITNESTQVYARVGFAGAAPNFLAADWAIQ